jgi:hypothetical protein
MKDELLEAAYLAGFNASGEGYNGEYPFQDHNAHPEQDDGWVKGRDKAITAIKQARSAPVQEPVAWGNLANWCLDSDRVLITDKTEAEKYHRDVYDLTPLYTTPPAAPVQEPVAQDVQEKCRIEAVPAKGGLLPAAPVQEPVAFLANGTRFKISYDSRQSGGQIHGIPPELGGRWVAFVAADDDCHLKLTTPPAAQRQWVGLTDEDMPDIRAGDHAFLSGARWAEAKLKEKNNG